MASQFQEYFDLKVIPQEKLSNCPWREDFMKSLLKITQKNGLIWSEIVNSIDRDEATHKKHREMVFETIQSTFEGLIIDATTLYEKHLEVVTKFSEKVDHLEMILEVDPSYEELADKEMSLVEVKELQIEKIEKLEKEIATREQVQSRKSPKKDRAQNLQEAIESCKKKLEIMWDKCQCEGEIRNEFPYMYTTIYTDEIFEIFKTEIRKWEAYFDQYREILNTVKSYERILREADELELNSNQNELYKNRNGLLLTEVRKRNLMNSRLKHLEEKLRKQNEYYLQRNQRSFRSYGTTVEALLQKGTKKKKFLSAAILSPKHKSKIPTAKTPQSRGTPVDGTKKKNKTPVSEHRRKILTPQRVTPTLPKFKLNDNKKISPTNKLEWKPSRLSMKLSKLQFGEDSSYTTEYSDFEKEVIQKDVPRSSDIGTHN